MKAESMSGAVKYLLEKYPVNFEFGLWDLKKDVFRLYPPSRDSHADTVSRRLREYRHGKDYEIICINPCKSRYKKVKITRVKYRPPSKKGGRKWTKKTF
jgi:hypothetical protein